MRKIELLRKKNILVDTGIYIKEDYSPAVLQKRKDLQEDLKRERQAGNKVALRYDKLVRLDQHLKPINETQNNKRFLSESPESAGGSKTYEKKETIKQVPKKNKSNNITSYLRASQLNPALSPRTSEPNENQKN